MKIGMLALLGTVLILSALFFSLRNIILKNILDNKIGSYQGNHEGAVLSIATARFSRLDCIDLENVQLRSADETLAVGLGKCSIQVNFWKMLLGKVRLKRLALSDFRIDLYGGSTLNPISSRAPGGGAQAKPSQDVGRMSGYGARIAELLDLYFNRIPDSLTIDRLSVHSDIDDIKQDINVPRLEIQGPAFATGFEINSAGRKWSCLFAGEIDRRAKLLALRLLPLRSSEPLALPFIDRQWGVRISFDLIDIRLKSNGFSGGVLRLDGALAVNGLTLNYPRIAAEDVRLQNAAVDYVLNIGADFFELDKRTRISFNKLSFNPYCKFKVAPTMQLTLKLDKTKFKAADFFSSLPDGLFSKLAGIQTRGQLAYEFDFFVDFSRPEELNLQANLEKSAFRIKRFGRVDFTAVNEPFLYTAYEKDQTLRSFTVGPENPNFRSLDQIPPFLKAAVLISEDSVFFGHKGFLLVPFKESIAVNIKEKRFVRGASTISMQLVKNLYLKRQKTIARKLEEMLITWLIEENRLVAKERMYEIYLNIIEWGPLVYGAQEAARFYFAKDVAELTLAEAIFMASIIPRPKRFMYSFDNDQHLRQWLQAYYSDVSYKMLKREMISRQDYDMLIPDIRLKGPARFLLKGNESMPADLLWQSEEIVE